VAFRALSWIHVLHFLGPGMDPDLRREMERHLYLHGLHLEYNLSIYFSPNTHLLGEAVALHALGLLFPAPAGERWRALGSDIVEKEFRAQIHPDGSHFEHSTYYHVYALDFFILYSILAGRTEVMGPRLAAMAEFLAAIMEPRQEIPCFGDDDGGRLLHPSGQRNRFGRATLATCGVLFGRPEWVRDTENLHEQAVWWLGEPALDVEPQPGLPARSQLFPNIGLAMMSGNSLNIVADGGPFGVGSGGHSHSDTLSFTACSGREWILIDPGTYTYVSDPKARDAFRGSAFHNTLRIGGADQAVPASAFRWSDPPRTQIEQWHCDDKVTFFRARCSYRGFSHQRRFWFFPPDLLLIVDQIDGPQGEHELERFWHPSAVKDAGGGFFQIASAAMLNTGLAGSEIIEGWRSPAFLARLPSPAIRSSIRTPLPFLWPAAISFSGRRVSVSAAVSPSNSHSGGDDVLCHVSVEGESFTYGSQF
jgi:hypothetical protein